MQYNLCSCVCVCDIDFLFVRLHAITFRREVLLQDTDFKGWRALLPDDYTVRPFCKMNMLFGCGFGLWMSLCLSFDCLKLLIGLFASTCVLGLEKS